MEGGREDLESPAQVGGEVAGAGGGDTEDGDQEFAVTMTRVMVGLAGRGTAGWTVEGKGGKRGRGRRGLWPVPSRGTWHRDVGTGICIQGHCH